MTSNIVWLIRVTAYRCKRPTKYKCFTKVPLIDSAVAIYWDPFVGSHKCCSCDNTNNAFIWCIVDFHLQIPVFCKWLSHSRNCSWKCCFLMFYECLIWNTGADNDDGTYIPCNNLLVESPPIVTVATFRWARFLYHLRVLSKMNMDTFFESVANFRNWKNPRWRPWERGITFLAL